MDGGKMKSEFDKYINMIYVQLGDIGGLCIDNGRFLRNRKMDEAIDNLEETVDRNEEVATEAIVVGDLDILEKSNQIENNFDRIIAKMELEFANPNYKLN